MGGGRRISTSRDWTRVSVKRLTSRWYQIGRCRWERATDLEVDCLEMVSRCPIMVGQEILQSDTPLVYSAIERKSTRRLASHLVSSWTKQLGLVWVVFMGWNSGGCRVSDMYHVHAACRSRVRKSQPGTPAASQFPRGFLSLFFFLLSLPVSRGFASHGARVIFCLEEQ